MTEPENPDPGDSGAVDEDEAAINEALAALTAGVSVTATAEDEDGEDSGVGEDTVGDGDADDDDDGAPDEDAADALLAGLALPRASAAPINFGDPGAETDPGSEPVVTVPDLAFEGDEADRIERLEDVARALVSAATARDDGRVRRKVQASATGAAAAGAVPLILQLTGALNLTAEESATVTAAAAALASFVSGYLTPERKPALESEVVHEALKLP